MVLVQQEVSFLQKVKDFIFETAGANPAVNFQLSIYKPKNDNSPVRVLLRWEMVINDNDEVIIPQAEVGGQPGDDIETVAEIALQFLQKWQKNQLPEQGE